MNACYCCSARQGEALSRIVHVWQLDEALEASRTEVTRLHAEREHYEETMKKAFMRGVCALNMEAMTMFQDGDSHGQCTVLPCRLSTIVLSLESLGILLL